ncbi:MAG: hypothetical protein PW788_12155 [Micavibrio sp.]|nr:hypothetical protein [Micavibrio sp.]
MTDKKPDIDANAAIAAFLKAIGPRALTDVEARQLKILRLQHGLDDVGGVIEKLKSAD